jgi:hypothetical protein
MESWGVCYCRSEDVEMKFWEDGGGVDGSKGFFGG